MNHPRLPRARHLAGAAAIAVVLAAPASAGPRATVSVGIQVEPVATITLPAGSEFTLQVAPAGPPPGRADKTQGAAMAQSATDGVVIHPLWLPFIIKGNAHATVTAAPREFVRVAGGRHLGKARLGTRPATLGYDVVVHFPVARGRRAPFTQRRTYGFFGIPGFQASLPLSAPRATPPLTVAMPSLGQEALGIVHLLSGAYWTTDGRRASAGVYRGSVEITVTADPL